MRHIALVTTSYPDREAGAEAAGGFVEDFASELAQYLRVTVVAASCENSVVSDGPLTTRRFAAPRLPLSLLRPLHPADWLPILRSLRAGQAAVDAMIELDPPDLILALWALPSGYWARRAGSPHGIPYHTWALGSDIWSLSRIPIVRQVLARVLRSAERRYADGLQLAEDVAEICGTGCEFLPSVRRLPEVQHDSTRSGRGTRLAFLGRWHRNKGIDLLFDALDRLDDNDWRDISQVRICGGGPMQDLVHSRAHALVQRGRPVTVEGYMDRVAAAELLRWTDFLALPSRIESIPVVFSDAIQTATPLIATPAGDLPRLMEQYAVGVLAASFSAADYAAAVRQALRLQLTTFDTGMSSARKAFELSSVVDAFVAGLGKS